MIFQLTTWYIGRSHQRLGSPSMMNGMVSVYPQMSQMGADVYSVNDRTLPGDEHLMPIVQQIAAPNSMPTNPVFYHLQLRCFVVVDDKLSHPSDAPTLDLILCQTKDRVLAEYALRDIHQPVGVPDYELTRALPRELASSLPIIEDLEAELSQDYFEEDGETGGDES